MPNKFLTSLVLLAQTSKETAPISAFGSYDISYLLASDKAMRLAVLLDDVQYADLLEVCGVDYCIDFLRSHLNDLRAQIAQQRKEYGYVQEQVVAQFKNLLTKLANLVNSPAGLVASNINEGLLATIAADYKTLAEIADDSITRISQQQQAKFQLKAVVKQPITTITRFFSGFGHSLLERDGDSASKRADSYASALQESPDYDAIANIVRAFSVLTTSSRFATHHSDKVREWVVTDLASYRRVRAKLPKIPTATTPEEQNFYKLIDQLLHLQELALRMREATSYKQLQFLLQKTVGVIAKLKSLKTRQPSLFDNTFDLEMFESSVTGLDITNDSGEDFSVAEKAEIDAEMQTLLSEELVAREEVAGSSAAAKPLLGRIAMREKTAIAELVAVEHAELRSSLAAAITANPHADIRKLAVFTKTKLLVGEEVAETLLKVVSKQQELKTCVARLRDPARTATRVADYQQMYRIYTELTGLLAPDMVLSLPVTDMLPSEEELQEYFALPAVAMHRVMRAVAICEQALAQSDIVAAEEAQASAAESYKRLAYACLSVDQVQYDKYCRRLVEVEAELEQAQSGAEAKSQSEIAELESRIVQIKSEFSQIKSQRIKGLHELLQVTKQLMAFQSIEDVVGWFREKYSDGFKAGHAMITVHDFYGLSYKDFLLAVRLTHEYKQESESLTPVDSYLALAIEKFKHPYEKYLELLINPAKSDLIEKTWESLISIIDIETQLQEIITAHSMRNSTAEGFALFNRCFEYCLTRKPFDLNAAEMSLQLVKALVADKTREGRATARLAIEKLSPKLAKLLVVNRHLTREHIDFIIKHHRHILPIIRKDSKATENCLARWGKVASAEQFALLKTKLTSRSAELKIDREGLARSAVAARSAVTRVRELEVDPAKLARYQPAEKAGRYYLYEDWSDLARWKEVILGEVGGTYEQAYQTHAERLVQFSELLLDPDHALYQSLFILGDIEEAKESIREDLLSTARRLTNALDRMEISPETYGDFATRTNPQQSYAVLLLRIACKILPDSLTQKILTKLKQLADRDNSSVVNGFKAFFESIEVSDLNDVQQQWLLQTAVSLIDQPEELMTSFGLFKLYDSAFFTKKDNFSHLITVIATRSDVVNVIERLLQARVILGFTAEQVRKLITYVEIRLSDSATEYAEFLANLPLTDEVVVPIIAERAKAAAKPAVIADAVLSKTKFTASLSGTSVVVPEVLPAFQVVFRAMQVKPAVVLEGKSISAENDKRELEKRFANTVLEKLTDVLPGNPHIESIKTCAENLNAGRTNIETVITNISHYLNKLNEGGKSDVVSELEGEFKQLTQLARELESRIEFFNRVRLYPAFVKIVETQGEVSSEEACQLLTVIRRQDVSHDEKFIFAQRHEFFVKMVQAIQAKVVMIDAALAAKLKQVIHLDGIEVNHLIDLLAADEHGLLTADLVTYFRDHFTELNPSGEQMARLVAVLAASNNKIAHQQANNILSGGSLYHAWAWQAKSSRSWIDLRHRLRQADLAHLMASSETMLQVFILRQGPFELTDKTRKQCIADFTTLVAKPNKTYAEYQLINKVRVFILRNGVEARILAKAAGLDLDQLEKNFAVALNKVDKGLANPIEIFQAEGAGRYLLDCYFAAYNAEVKLSFELTPVRLRAMMLSMANYPLEAHAKQQFYVQALRIIAASETASSISSLQRDSKAVIQLLSDETAGDAEQLAITQLFYLVELQKQAFDPMLQTAIAQAVSENFILNSVLQGSVIAQNELANGLLSLFVAKPNLFNRLIELEPVYKLVSLSANAALRQTLSVRINPDLPAEISDRVATDAYLQSEFSGCSLTDCHEIERSTIDLYFGFSATDTTVIHSMRTYLQVLHVNNCLEPAALVAHFSSMLAIYKAELTRSGRGVAVAASGAGAASPSYLTEDLHSLAERLLDALRNGTELPPQALFEEDSQLLALYNQALTIKYVIDFVRFLNELDSGCIKEFCANGLAGLFTYLAKQGIALEQEQANTLLEHLNGAEVTADDIAVVRRYLLVQGLQDVKMVTGFERRPSSARTAASSSAEELDALNTTIASDPKHHSRSSRGLSAYSLTISPLEERARLDQLFAEKNIAGLFVAKAATPESMDEFLEAIDTPDKQQVILNWLYDDVKRVKEFPELIGLLKPAVEPEDRSASRIMTELAKLPLDDATLTREVVYQIVTGELMFSDIKHVLPTEEQRIALQALITQSENAVAGQVVARDQNGMPIQFNQAILLVVLRQLHDYLAGVEALGQFTFAQSDAKLMRTASGLFSDSGRAARESLVDAELGLDIGVAGDECAAAAAASGGDYPRVLAARG